MALASGIFGALAYLMLARTRTKYTTSTIMLVWCVMSFVGHLVLFQIEAPVWPSLRISWSLVIVAGILASAAQHLATRAYQSAPAAWVASIAYLAPVWSLVLDFVFFKMQPTAYGWLGSSVILFFGLFPFLKNR